MLCLVTVCSRFSFLAIASTPASPELTRDYGIKSAISRKYRFLRETILLKASFLDVSFYSRASDKRDIPTTKREFDRMWSWQDITILNLSLGCFA